MLLPLQGSQVAQLYTAASPELVLTQCLAVGGFCNMGTYSKPWISGPRTACQLSIPHCSPNAGILWALTHIKSRGIVCLHAKNHDTLFDKNPDECASSCPCACVCFFCFSTGSPLFSHLTDMNVGSTSMSLSLSYLWMWVLICLSPCHSALHGKREWAEKMNSCLWHLDSISAALQTFCLWE